MRWFQSLFWNGYQRALVDPGLYDKPIKADEVRAEIAVGPRDYEARNFMQSALSDATDNAGDVTLKRVVDQLESVSWALKWETDRHMAECGRYAKLGGEMLADHLLARANRIASEIKPGAKDALGDALG
jgi:hypothetical protein